MEKAESQSIELHQDRNFFLFNAAISLAALGLLLWLLVIRQGDQSELDLRFMPAFNALLNGIAAILLSAGWYAICRRNIRLHKRLMAGSFVASTLFFVGYAAYKYVHGDTPYPGTGSMKIAYYAILISHIVLSIPLIPLALCAFYFAWKKRFKTHRRITRILAPIWLYVSITGVVVYFLLHH